MAHSPFSTVSLVVRIRGRVDEAMLRAAVKKVQQRHEVLHSRMVLHEDELWLTTMDVEPIPIDVFPRMNEETWITATREDCARPYAFDRQPAIRFLLLQSREICDVVIQCHHTICDGMSLAYLGRDLMVYLGVPDQPVEALPDPAPIGPENFPRGVKLPSVVKFFVNQINKKWADEQVVFDQQDYLALNQAYWQRYHHQMLAVDLTREQTESLVVRCRQEDVTVNTALVAAFIGAQTLVLGADSMPANIGVAADLRQRLDPPPGEGMGFYAGAVTEDLPYDLSLSFWENARKIHKKLTPMFTDKKLFADAVMWSALTPATLQAINYKRLGGLVPPESAKHEKLNNFSQRTDVISDMLKRNRMTSLDELIMGSAVTNLTRLDFPTKYGKLELERMILKPGGAFPLATVNLVVGAVTAANRLSLVIEYAEERLDARTAGIIKNQAVTHLLGE
ncbi:MAG: condensation domain-containing protein [Anaerolineales bacterium]